MALHNNRQYQIVSFNIKFKIEYFFRLPGLKNACNKPFGVLFRRRWGEGGGATFLLFFDRRTILLLTKSGGGGGGILYFSVVLCFYDSARQFLKCQRLG